VHFKRSSSKSLQSVKSRPTKTFLAPLTLTSTVTALSGWTPRPHQSGRVSRRRPVERHQGQPEEQEQNRDGLRLQRLVWIVHHREGWEGRTLLLDLKNALENILQIIQF
jgi:hypothetical protein